MTLADIGTLFDVSRSGDFWTGVFSWIKFHQKLYETVISFAIIKLEWWTFFWTECLTLWSHGETSRWDISLICTPRQTALGPHSITIPSWRRMSLLFKQFGPIARGSFILFCFEESFNVSSWEYDASRIDNITPIMQKLIEM